MDVLRINQGYLGEGSCNIPLNKESNIDATSFFELLKYLNESL